MKQKETLIFLHIPKCAGSTLRFSIFANWFSTNETVTACNSIPGSIEDYKLRDNANVKLVQGHFLYSENMHEYLSNQAVYFTMLRDPVDRFVSAFHYIKGNSTHPNHEKLRNLDFESYVFNTFDLNERRLIASNCNQQVAFLAGVENPDEEALDLAKSRIDSFLLAGLTERFDDSIITLRRLLGKPTPIYSKANKSARPKLGEISDTTLKMISDLSHLDTCLYEYTKQRFESLLESDLGLKNELETFQDWNSKLNHYSLVKEEVIKLRSSFEQQAQAQSIAESRVAQLRERLEVAENQAEKAKDAAQELSLQLFYSRQSLSALRRKLKRVRKKLKRKNKLLKARKKHLQHKINEIGSMQDSKFWKLRHAWFRLRYLLKLP